MKTWQKWLVGGAVVIGGASTGGYLLYKQGHPPKSNQQAPPAAKQDQKPPAQTVANKSPTPQTPAVKPSINTVDSAGLFNASYTKKLTDFTPWKDSGATVVYRDFNGDNTTDAFVWAKLPGTGGYSFAAVWTTDASGQPLELWHLPDSLLLGHSTWSVTSNDGLENKSLKSDGSTDASNTFHWQVSTTGQGFVLEPGI